MQLHLIISKIKFAASLEYCSLEEQLGRVICLLCLFPSKVFWVERWSDRDGVTWTFVTLDITGRRVGG